MATSAHRRDRRIGPIGIIARVAVGLAFVIVPIALGGIGWLDVAALAAYAVIAAATVAGFTAGLARRSTRLGPGLECCLVAVLLAEAGALGAVVPANLNVVAGSFLGISMLLAAARGDSGCELTAVPNAITGRRDHVGCMLFAPLDAADSRRQS
jgi:hypothetical protein